MTTVHKQDQKYNQKMKNVPFRTVLYGTLLVILKTRLGDFSGPFSFLLLELFGGGSSSSAISSMLHSCTVYPTDLETNPLAMHLPLFLKNEP